MVYEDTFAGSGILKILNRMATTTRLSRGRKQNLGFQGAESCTTNTKDDNRIRREADLMLSKKLYNKHTNHPGCRAIRTTSVEEWRQAEVLM